VQAARAQVHRDTMGGGNGGVVMLCRAKKDGDALYIGELKAVEGLTCAPRRRELIRVAAWAVGRGRDVRGRRPGYGGVARGRAARQGRVASGGRGNRAVRRKWEGPWRADRRTEAGLGVRYSGVSVRDARHGARRRVRGRERLASASCTIRLGPVELQFTPNF
jgi:hypothetical protein